VLKAVHTDSQVLPNIKPKSAPYVRLRWLLIRGRTAHFSVEDCSKEQSVQTYDGLRWLINRTVGSAGTQDYKKWTGQLIEAFWNQTNHQGSLQKEGLGSLLTVGSGM